ncbi:uncharacterized protein LOC131879621 [Tigriopus californicus]|uniref:uncharacterized protein LOC131879621 n=1 Tax=Tigriopus californicus TaxID=6832 RepID=UPI0027DA944F|nr:uncharacterized protein LOC131879621 [Tigriopus californicus]
MGLQYDVTRDVRPFSGEDILAYATFQSQWKRAESRLEDIGKGPIELLQEFKRVLKGQALQLVEYLPEIDENYAKAIAQIRRVYDDPSVQIKTIVDRLIDMPTIEYNKASLLKGFSFVNQALQSFDGLHLTADDLSTIFFISLCERKLNKNSLQTWHKYVQSKVDPNLPMGIDISREAFLDVLLKQVKLAPDRGVVCEEESKSKAYKSHSKGSAPATFLATQDHKCLFCNRSGHKNFACFKMQKMGYEGVEDIRRANRLCTRCLEPYNFEHRKQCKGPICSVQDCGRPTRHCKYLHNPNTQSIYVQQSPGVDQASERDLDNPVCSPMVSIAKQVENGQMRGILRTCIGFIKNIGDGELLKVRFLLDAAAEQNLIRRRCAQDLGLDGPRQYLQMSVAGGGSSKRTQEKIVEFQIQSLDGSYTSNPIKATSISSIAQPVKPITLNRSDFAHLHDITFTEEYPSSGELCLDVFIGEPLFTHLCIAPPVTGLLSEPAAQHTKLGWILCGAHPKGSAEIPAVKYTVMATFSRTPMDLQSFWQQEHLGISPIDDSLTVEEEEAMQMMSQMSSYDPRRKKWSSSLLWKDDPNYVLANNYIKAKGVMTSVEKRTKPEHRVLLNEAYSTMIEQGTAERVPDDEINPNDGRFLYYLETHPILKESTTTKCRVVMNASSKDGQSKKSLNDLLYTGPNLLPDIAELQLRFRAKKIAIIADITKMFLSIELHSDHDALRYFWRNLDPNQKTQVYRMVAVTFGIKSSPFQAIWCLLQTAEMFANDYPEAVQEIRSNLYMDDLSTTADSEDLARKLLDDVVTVLDLGGFRAHKFASNCSGVLVDLRSDDCLTGMVSTLGLQWDTLQDTLGFNYMS